MNYEIGQVIFVVSSKTQTVWPVVIQEEITSKRLNGQEVSYKVLFGPANVKDPKIKDLSRVDGEIFGSIEEVREYFLKGFAMLVDNLCDKAQQNAVEWYGIVDKNGQNIVDNGGKIDPSTIMSDINNSSQPQYVQIHGNRGVPVNMQNPNTPTNYQSARKQLQQKMADSEEQK